MLAIAALFFLAAGDQVRVNWLAPPSCVPVPEYSMADFSAILGGDKPTPTDEAFKDCPLEAYDSQQRTAILKSLARSHDERTHPSDTFEDSSGSCAGYDWQRGNVRVSCRSAKLTWLAGSSRWGLTWRHLVLPSPKCVAKTAHCHHFHAWPPRIQRHAYVVPVHSRLRAIPQPVDAGCWTIPAARCHSLLPPRGNSVAINAGTSLHPWMSSNWLSLLLTAHMSTNMTCRLASLPKVSLLLNLIARVLIMRHLSRPDASPRHPVSCLPPNSLLKRLLMSHKSPHPLILPNYPSSLLPPQGRKKKATPFRLRVPWVSATGVWHCTWESCLSSTSRAPANRSPSLRGRIRASVRPYRSTRNRALRLPTKAFRSAHFPQPRARARSARWPSP